MKTSFKNIHGLFSFKRLLKVLIVLAVLIQLGILLYNHYSGYHVLPDFRYFMWRLLRGITISLIAAFVLAYPDMFMIYHLNKTAPWGKKNIIRIVAQLLFAVSYSVVLSIAITTLVNWVQPYRETFSGVLVSNALIYAIANLFIMAILEGWMFFGESRQAEQRARSLQEELSQIKFEVLKSQINPHFMFNSLNVLSGLINKDVSKAQQFIDEFSHIYRYVLETIEQPVTTLEKELDFMRSYLFLQQIRYGNALSYSVNIPAQFMKLVLPPLSLQVVLENAIKHNIINESKPLKIELLSENHYLMVKNNIQPKISMGTSTGLGLKNLSKRYTLISSEKPVFSVETNHYLAKLPLIDVENVERTHYRR